MLTCANWIIQQLPGRVVEHQRADVIKTLAEAPDLVVEVAVTPTPMVRLRGRREIAIADPGEDILTG